MIPAQHIFLLGLPASGKSTLGKALAQELERPFIDTDQMIEQQQQMTISRIFEDYGEVAFRQLECQLLDNLPSEFTVVATGGGLPCFGSNMDSLKQSGVTIYLEVPEEILVQRLKGETSKRPLLQNKSDEELLQTLRQHLEKRKPYYRRADLIFSGANISTQLLVERLAGF